jgi:hypothetical protein
MASTNDEGQLDRGRYRDRSGSKCDWSHSPGITVLTETRHELEPKAGLTCRIGLHTRYSLGICISRAKPTSLVSGGFHPNCIKAVGSATSAPESRS